jgi:hypothetical protein
MEQFGLQGTGDAAGVVGTGPPARATLDAASTDILATNLRRILLMENGRVTACRRRRASRPGT